MLHPCDGSRRLQAFPPRAALVACSHHMHAYSEHALKGRCVVGAQHQLCMLLGVCLCCLHGRCGG